MSAAGEARQALEDFITACRAGDRQAQVDLRRALQQHIKHLAKLAHVQAVPADPPGPRLALTDDRAAGRDRPRSTLGSPEVARAAVATVTVLADAIRTVEPSDARAALAEAVEIANAELLTGPPAAVWALIALAAQLAVGMQLEHVALLSEQAIGGEL